MAIRDDSPVLSPAHMFWKYWAAWPGWEGARSFVATQDDVVVAHAAVVPLSIARQGRSFTLLQPLDWAAEPSQVGAGVWLLKQLRAHGDGLVNIRGSDATRRILGPLGYRSLAPVTRYVKPLDSPAPLSAAAGACTLRLHRRSAAGASPHPLQFAESQPLHIVPRRTLAHVEAWLVCPIAEMEYGELFLGRDLVASFALCRTPGQVRWVDAWASPARADGYPVLTEHLMHHVYRTRGEVAEVVCQTNQAEHERALLGAGYRSAGADPLSVLASTDLIADGATLRHYLVDSDLAYLHHGSVERWCDDMESPQ